MKKFAIYHSLIILFILLLMNGCERGTVVEPGDRYKGKAHICFGISDEKTTRALTSEKEKEAAIENIQYAYGSDLSASSFNPILLPTADASLPYTTDISIEAGKALFLANFKASDISPSKTISEVKQNNFNFLNPNAGTEIEAKDLFPSKGEYGFLHPKTTIEEKEGNITLDVPDLNPDIKTSGHYIPMVADHTSDTQKVTLTPDPSNPNLNIVTPNPIMMERLFAKFYINITKDFTQLPNKLGNDGRTYYVPAYVELKDFQLLRVPKTFSIDGPKNATPRVNVKGLCRASDGPYDGKSYILNISLVGGYWDAFYLPETLSESEDHCVELIFTVKIHYTNTSGVLANDSQIKDERTYQIPLGERDSSSGGTKYRIKRNTVHQLYLVLQGWSEVDLKVKYIVKEWREKNIEIPAFE